MFAPITDHSQVHAHPDFHIKENCIEKTKWLFDKCDFETLNFVIQNENWTFIEDHELNIDQISETFISKLNAIFSKYIPSIKYYLRPKDKPWMNNTIRREQRRRDRLHKKAKLYNTQTIWSNYRTQRNYLTYLIRKAKREHDITLLDRLNALDRSDAGWWKIVKSTFGSAQESIPALEYSHNNNKVYANDNKSKADLLNEIFINVTKIDDDRNVFPEQFPRTEARLPDIQITTDDVIEAIGSIPDNKAPGPDSINSFLLTRIGGALAPVLHKLINR